MESDPDELGEEETAAQKRVRTAKDFIRQLEARVSSDDENDEENERVNKLLEADAFVKSGVMRRAVAHKVRTGTIVAIIMSLYFFFFPSNARTSPCSSY